MLLVLMVIKKILNYMRHNSISTSLGAAGNNVESGAIETRTL